MSPSRSYLNDARVRAWRMPASWAAEWWMPGALLSSVEAERDLFDGDAFFNAPGLKSLREAYVASKFALCRDHLEEIRVRMVAEQFPDFRLLIDDAVQDFEQVEADKPGRRRGAEYRDLARREAAGEKIGPEPYDPWGEKKLVPAAILKALEQKAAMSYASPSHLLVYVNLGNMGGPAINAEEAAKLTREWHPRFRSIWLLCGDVAIRCS